MSVLLVLLIPLARVLGERLEPRLNRLLNASFKAVQPQPPFRILSRFANLEAGVWSSPVSRPNEEEQSGGASSLVASDRSVRSDALCS